jgi:hypothetical protein
MLCDAGELPIPTSRVDTKQPAARSHRNIAFIRGFMVFFGRRPGPTTTPATVVEEPLQ